MAETRRLGDGAADEIEAKGDSDMEGWEDDGWGDINPTPRQESAVSAPKPRAKETSGGADFFDSLGVGNTQKTKSKDPFENYGYSDPRPAKPSRKENTPPPLTSASLFGGSGLASNSGGVAGDGWGDWSEDFEVQPVPSKVKYCVLCKCLW